MNGSRMIVLLGVLVIAMLANNHVVAEGKNPFEKALESRFNSTDTNQDGKITFEEYLAGYEKAIKYSFKIRDSNRDGVLTREEFMFQRKGLGVRKHPGPLKREIQDSSKEKGDNACSPGRAEDNSEIKALVHGNNVFAFDLYAQLRGSRGNLFFSPYSISTALAMTFAGARGNTAKQMAEVLHFPLAQKHVHRAFGRLETRLNAVRDSGTIDLNVANALWAQKEYRFLSEFLDLVTGNYGAELSYADFKTAHEAARKEINDWVGCRTNMKIKDLIKPGLLNSLTRLVLVNAIYFKGSWRNQFEESATKDACFWVAPELKVDVPMMGQEHEFNYMETSDTQVLELPYLGNDLSMVILLPKKIDGLAQLETSLSIENLNAMLASLKKRKIMIYLPRFKISSGFSLEKTLALLGMPDAFDPNSADFSGIVGLMKLCISRVVHKAFVEINEEGTEATAATGVVMRSTAAPVATKVFRVDRPFVFLICDNRSGSILFLGRIVNPKK
jgi:serpin B